MTVVTRPKGRPKDEPKSTSPTAAGATGVLVCSTSELGGAEQLDPIALFGAAMKKGFAPFLWLQPDRGFAIVGSGAAWTVDATGPGRFEAIADAWEARLADAQIRLAMGAGHGVGPVLVGGLGFTGKIPADPTWTPFGAASMTLPEVTLTKTTQGSWLTTSFVAGPPSGKPGDAVTPARLEARRQELLALAHSPIADVGGSKAGALLTVTAEQPERPAWERLIDRLAGAVGRGRLDKVVMARRTDLEAGQDIDVVGALRRLAEGSPNSTTYAVCRGGSVFVGATPERLISTQGREFQTVAMAGSTRHADNATEDAALADELLGSGKDREEHGIVVEMLRAMLDPIVDELVVAPAPVVAAYGPVQHLVTTITGRLQSRAGILKLAALLHPTPAVGGEPRELALELIAEHERFERGWYAGPLGWVGTDGDGELAVALRCAVIAGRTAALFAGCGIVADSDPAREWEESRNKMQVVAAALGEVES